ncbi:MAG TPA: flavodoxin family protein [Clostridia bacterium]|nr:flavodoxin family protein [Clostridia bacterium]
MRIVMLISSGRRGGNTDGISVLLEKELLMLAQKSNTELIVDKYVLGHQEIKNCRGCRVCFDRGEKFCPLKDDLQLLWEQIKAADGIVLGSPVYVEDVNGIMKNWIDRMAFNCHRPGLAGKAAYVYTTSGAGSSNHSIHTMKTALATWGAFIAGSSRFRAGALSKIDELKAEHGKKIGKAAAGLFDAIRNKRPLKPSLYSLLTFNVQQTSWRREDDKTTVDYRYWDDNGWLDKGCRYYFPNDVNPVKVLAARLLGKAVALFFL